MAVMKYDVIIIGAGPAGLGFALSLADTSLNVLVIEKAPLAAIREPAEDGREIALTHLSVKILKELGAWEKLPDAAVNLIRAAKVVNGDSSYSLDFDHDPDIETLGYMVPNYRIRQCLYDAVITHDNIALLTDTAVANVHTDREHAVVTVENGDEFEAQLVVAADSRFSSTRRMMGIPAMSRDFGKVAIVCRMEHELPHHDTAVECFHYGRTLAVLPLPGNVSSIVITASTAEAERIVNMSEDEFNADIQQRFGNRLGWMKLVGKRHPYPLVAVHADAFVKNRFALIGDAAVGMHPVTAHGFNLGLRGANTLAREIKKAMATGRDFAALDVLRRYEQTHLRFTRPMYHGTNGIVDLFTNDSVPAKALRHLVVRLANNLPPVKKLITRSLTEKNRGRGLLPF
jgi:ubiquinone biosynthesis UbiH/UbiF/VisC/COQ6 family hydroxylase